MNESPAEVAPFEGAGESPGLSVWRIVDLKPTKVASQELGDFAAGKRKP